MGSIVSPDLVVGDEAGREGTHAADAIVVEVVLGLLDHVATDDGLVAVRVVLLVRDEVRLAQELLLVVLELAHHDGWRSRTTPGSVVGWELVWPEGEVRNREPTKKGRPPGRPRELREMWWALA